MDTKRKCSGCQQPLAQNAPDGLCPACLIKAGLGTGVDIGPDSQGEDRRTAFVAPAPEEVARLFPQLEILGFIGQGGMGAVYQARQKELDRVVALKILPPGIGKDPAFAQRFAREAKALAKLNHPGIVTLYEFGQADGLFYFLMEFVDGVNLRRLLEAGRLSPREALAIVPQICDALQYAHDQGIVHRDIKPENILLDRKGRVKVADFGLAKLVGTEGELSAVGGAAATSAVLTETGTVMGTPQYMAPEQREHPADVDHRADIYSLGMVFYQMLTGELPGKPIEPPSLTVRVDVRLDEVVLRALEKEPERRYQQVSQMKSAVETIGRTAPPQDAMAAAPPAGASHTNAPPSANKEPQAGAPSPRLLKGDAGFVTTPEQLGTFAGQLFLWHRRSQLLLDERQLTVSRAGAFTVIPLAAIRDLSIGHYGRVMHPLGLDFISVTYDADGQTRRLYFSPYESWFGLPSDFNRIVAEWFNAIRAAVLAATGREPGNAPANQLGVPSASKALYALLLGPAVLGGTLVAVLLLRNSGGDAPRALEREPPKAAVATVPAEPQRRSAHKSRTFGPVIERVIGTADADDQGLVFFDVETGKSSRPPFPLTFHPNQGPAFVELTPDLKQWIKAHDVDVLLHLGEKTWDLMTLQMQEEFAGQLKDWETIPPENVIGLFAKKDAEHLVRDEVPASSFGHSYRDGFGSFHAFRTRSNTMGVYQFEGVDNSTRHGVGIRYKLVQEVDRIVRGINGK